MLHTLQTCDLNFLEANLAGEILTIIFILKPNAIEHFRANKIKKLTLMKKKIKRFINHIVAFFILGYLHVRIFFKKKFYNIKRQ